MLKSKTLPKILVGLLLLTMVLGLIYLVSGSSLAEASYSKSPYIQLNDTIKVNTEQYYDGTKIVKLPSNVKDGDMISVIVKSEAECLYDAYKASKSKLSFSEYIATDDAKAVKTKISKENEKLKSILDKTGVEYKQGNGYDTVLSGFEIVIKAGDFEAVAKSIDGRATPIVGEVYNKAETTLVENKVNVYETGIFDSSKFEINGKKYDGTGMVVAVLDTGLDYTHTAFSLSNFGVKDENKLGLKYQDIVNLLNNNDFYAEKLQSGLTANDVFISNKVPFGFDYADGDSEVFPINSDHGTHVAGIIAGKDNEITGVAPNAQLVIMKTFSDVESTARTAWILSALEDCVALGVDVINMSLGTDCGFSRPSDKENVNNIYERIKDAGISLVVAASNSYNSTYGSEKNGNLGLTSNPDSSTVGSPSTYDGALSIASISGVKTPYLLFGERIIYFTESADRVSEEKVFLDDVLKDGQKEAEIEFITIPGVGRNADYTGIDVKGKIVLVRRGSSTFEEKANVAQEKGALGIIVYNNVSGDIKMNVGDASLGACSISQADGEILAAAKTGKIKVARNQTSGPFMSDFSSWGPTPSLGIKPELTAHGGSIYSAVPGQDYDRISGTSMATPNMSGVCALLRQYVIDAFPEIKDDPTKVTTMVNCLLMSTADIVYNKNGLPYSVRKQGAGLANLTNAAKTSAYIITKDKDGNNMDRTKIELGDDPTKTGVYELNFSIVNFGDKALTYDLEYYVLTEGVSETKTSHGETTVTETAYVLNGATVVVAVTGGEQKNDKITVEANKTANVKVTITLGESDRKYLDESFENGMYVEGFISLKAVSGTGINLGFPFLGFYGDWSKAPIFDLDFYATNKDELDDAIDIEDKTLPDAYATRPIGSIEGDYVNFMGSFYFEQDPTEKPIAADRKYISISNQTGAVNSLEYVWAGLLRNCQRIEVTITEDATGEVVFETVDYDVRKSYSNGQTIYPANVDIGFSAMEQNLKNNTKYTVTLKSYLDFENDGSETNANNTFTFPLVTDFEAPIVEDVQFYTEYDKSNKETRLFAKVAIYDNHYTMGMQVGFVGDDGSGGLVLNAFDQYIKAVYSDFNSTSYVIYELTDYIQKIKEGAYNKNTFTIACYDYALNLATYEIGLPDDYTDFYFDLGVDKDGNKLNEVVLSPNQTYDLNPTVYPNTEWGQLLKFSVRSKERNVARIVNDKVIALKPGVASVIAEYFDEETKTTKSATFTLRVLGENDEGYKKYSKPVVDEFYLTGYLVDRAYYFMNSMDRELGMEGDEMKFVGENYKLSMYPSEKVTIRYVLDAYFPDATKIEFTTSSDKIATVDANGQITANEEGYATITAKVYMDGKSTVYSKAINITVKDPYKNSGPMLTNYFGNGGAVVIKESLAITQIGQFAFSNYKYVPKQAWEIDPDSNETYKMWFVGDDTITSVIIPEGVETIGAYAFANLTALEEVTLPSTLKMIDQGAFYGCSKLTKVNGLENVKFINQYAFYGCNLKGEIKLDNAAAVANYAFATGLITDYYEDKVTGEAGWITKKAGENEFTKVTLSDKTQSVGAYAFYGAKNLESVTFKADKMQLGMCAFADCSSLVEISLNAQVIPTGLLDGCTSLTKVTIGKDVMQIGEYAFRGAEVTEFTVEEGNGVFYSVSKKPYILNNDGTQILYVSPGVSGELIIDDDKITSIAKGAFSGNNKLTKVSIKTVTEVGDYAFAGCTELAEIELGALTKIGTYAFHNTKITKTHDFKNVKEIGTYAYAETAVQSVIIPDGVTVGEGAFRDCKGLTSIEIGNNVKLGTDAFRFNNMLEGNYKNDFYEVDGKKIYYFVYISPITSLKIGNNVEIGDSAFYGCAELTSVELGEGAKIGNYAFYNACSLVDIDLSKVVEIGNYAFSGDVLYKYLTSDMRSSIYQNDDGTYNYAYYASQLAEIDLSALTSIGQEAFAHSQKLTKVTLGEGVKNISQRAFANCCILEEINLSGVEIIGTEAFAETAVKKAELYSVKEIGKYAFVYVDELTEVYFNNGETVNEITILEGAFSYCESLDKIVGLENAIKIDSYAFAYVPLENLDLSKATYIGDFAFMKEDKTEITLVLGDGLTYIGENPFAMCILKPFSKTVKESFNGKDYEKTIYTYDISDTVKIIDGSIYKTVKNGLVLVAYAGGESGITVADTTVRISAFAFAGSDIQKVVLPRTVASIGHKAFYGCDSLAVVSFSSYNAPILEEEYDYSYYASMENLPASGDYDFTDVSGNPIVIPGLGITDYFMYNVTGDPTNIYYGANFVDYVGKVANKLVMVRPANGQNYNSFIFKQYFDVVVDGDIAPDDITLSVIAAINNLPEKVALSDKALVELARALYNKIMTNEQKSIVDENGLYAKLTAAEKRISDLEFLQNDGNQDPDVPNQGGDNNEEPSKNKLPGGAVAAIVILSIVAAAAIGGFVVLLIMSKKDKSVAVDAQNVEKTKENSEVNAEVDTEAAEAEKSSDNAADKKDAQDESEATSEDNNEQ